MITKSKINQAGYCFIEKDSKLFRDEASIILQEFRAIHQHPMALFRHLIDRKLKNHKIDALVSQRLKRIPSIIKKLKIQKTMNLSQMQDIGGLRIVVNSINEVNLIRDSIKKVETHGSFKFSFDKQKNYIETPPESGYRSIHIVYKYDKNIPTEKQCRVEIQIRTKLQHSWATAVEVTGTYLNQSLKQSFGDEKYLDIFKKISKLFISVDRKDIGIDYKLANELKKDIENVQLLDKLQNFRIVTKHFSNNSTGQYLLLKMDFEQQEVEIAQYAKAKFEQANKYYSQIELEYWDNKAIEVVLLSIQDIKKLEQSYPNYFMDTAEFIKNLEKMFDLSEELENIQKILNNIDDKKFKKVTSKMFKAIFMKMNT